MRWAVALSLSVGLIACASGCRSNRDVVESELRAREGDVRELKEELDKAEFYNHALQREVRALRGEPGPDGHVERPVEAYPVRALVLGQRTGGRRSDTAPGDDALEVLVEPRDPQGQAIKAPGTLYVEAQEVTPEGLKRPLSVWEVPPEKLAEKWSPGLFTTGYFLTLPWKAWPSTEKLRVVARFRLNDGRVFEADKDVTVRVAPALKRTAPPSPVPSILPAPGLPQPAPTPAPLPLPPPPAKKGVLPAPTPTQPAPSGPSLDQAALYRDAAIRLRPVVEMLKPIACPPEK